MLMIFGRKTAQFHEMQRKSDSLGLPMKNTLRNAVQTCAKLVRPIRNQLLYQAELRAQIADGT